MASNSAVKNEDIINMRRHEMKSDGTVSTRTANIVAGVEETVTRREILIF